ncbi:hypothetical protein Ddye_023541 [Dipteronia dyeriana]|uniref:Reverse transcriptase domain-containing protein n=1 Tax=Dipteronia dyeriana TaxID=168575 RepID=A0AAD9WTC1_9ROSI|nr:hypothetical protein Ddye_023541 [Dipteronia dyeriana]
MVKDIITILVTLLLKGLSYQNLFNCDGNKTPRPDGLKLNFVRSNYEVIHDDFTKFIREFHTNNATIGELNNTLIALIPKCVKLETLSDFRLISLVGSMYKVLAKVLANRINKVMNSIIGESHKAFVKGHQILNSFVIAKKNIHERKMDKEEGLLVKLDIKKAYDSGGHDFLDSMMEDMGFGVK